MERLFAFERIIECLYEVLRILSFYFKDNSTLRVTVSASFCIKPSFTDLSADFIILSFFSSVFPASLRNEIDLQFTNIEELLLLF